MTETPFYADPNKLQERDKAATYVFESYDRSKRLLVDPKREQWKEGYRAYRMVLDLKKSDGLQSRIPDALIFTNVEDFLPRLVAQNPRIEVWGRTQDQADQDRANQHRAKLFYDWDNMGMVLRTMEFVKSAEVFGTAWFKTVYKKTVEVRGERRLEQPQFFGIQTGGARMGPVRKVSTLTYDDPCVELCEVDEVFPDPDAKSVENCAFIIHRVKTTLHAIKSAKKGSEPLYKPEVVAQLEQMAKDGGNNPVSPHTGEQSIFDMKRERFDDAGAASPDPFKLEYHLLEMWTPSQTITVVEEHRGLPPILNTWNEIGKIPFVRFTPIPDINGIYGISLAEALYSHWVELSTMRASRIDNIRYMVHQMYKILRGSGINPKQIRFRPGGHIDVKDMGDIQLLERGHMPNALYRELDDIRRSAQQVGATDTFSGVASDLTGRTATEASILAEASGSRASLMFRILGEQALTPLGHLLIRLNELYLEAPKFYRIAGEEYLDTQFPAAPQPEFIEIRPEGLVARGPNHGLDVKIDIASVEPGNKQVRLQRSERALEVLGALGMSANHPFVMRMLVELGQGMGIQRPEKFIFSQEAQQAVAEQEAQGQEQPQNGNGAQTPADQIAAALGASEGGNVTA